MPKLDLLQEIGKKETDKDEIVDGVIRNPELISEIIEGREIPEKVGVTQATPSG
jgi:hypothetical protein